MKDKSKIKNSHWGSIQLGKINNLTLTVTVLTIACQYWSCIKLHMLMFLKFVSVIIASYFPEHVTCNRYRSHRL